MAAKSIDGSYLQSNYYKRSQSWNLFNDGILCDKTRSIRRDGGDRLLAFAAGKPFQDLRAAKDGKGAVVIT